MNLWQGQKQAYKDAINYMLKRKSGEETSIITPWPKFNDAGINGIEWNNLIVIGARPGSGKTLLKDQIIRESFNLNPNEDFRVLEFNFEMLPKTSAIRQFSSITGKTYKELLSANSKISDNVIKYCSEYAKQRIQLPIDTIYKSVTISEFKNQIDRYMEYHKGKKTIITLDHTLLIKKDAKHGNNFMPMLFELGEAFTHIKRTYPCTIIALSQLNRNVDNPDRAVDGKYGNYILTSDIFGSDAMLQHADMLIGMNRPAQQKIKFYGPQRYIIKDDRTLVFHFLKVRNGDPRMSFFKAVFEKMEIHEMETPDTQV
jgi:replicative DNA helicase